MPEPLTPAQRVAQAQARQLEEGWRRLSLRLRPEFARALDAICQRTGETPTALISRLLASEANSQPSSPSG